MKKAYNASPTELAVYNASKEYHYHHYLSSTGSGRISGHLTMRREELTASSKYFHRTEAENALETLLAARSTAESEGFTVEGIAVTENKAKRDGIDAAKKTLLTLGR